MSKQKTPSLPLSAEARDAVVQMIRDSQEPLLAKQVAAGMAGTHSASEAQVISVLEEYVAAGSLLKYPAMTAKGKPRYWDRDLRALARTAIREALQAAPAPLTAKDLAGAISTLKLSEAEVTEILKAEIVESDQAGQALFVFPSTKAKGKPLYWDRDVRALIWAAVLEAAQHSEEPFTAKDLAGRLKVPGKITEADIIPLLEDAVTAGTLHHLPGTKTKPRYWNQDLLQFGARQLLQAIQAKGPQKRTSFKSLMKGLSPAQIDQAVEHLVGTGAIVKHPSLGKTKDVVYGVRPPSPTPYFTEIGRQVKTTVALLKEARVSVDDLRRTLVEMIEEAGVPLVKRPSIDLVSLMKQLEPAAERGALVAARDLRRAAPLSKLDFDRAVLDLVGNGKLSLHRHDYPASLSEIERDELVTDGLGTFYIGMSLRSQ